MAKKQKKHSCPLCGSHLTEMKYFEIVGVWDAKAKAEQEIKDKLKDVERQKKEMIEKQKIILKQKELEKKNAIKTGIETGKKKEKSRADKMAKQATAYLEQVKTQNKKIKELQEQLKKGTTSQEEGKDFEKELENQLKKAFPSDKIGGTPGGRGGDIMHEVIFKSKVIGSILYECKKTAKFSSDYIHQTKKAISSRNATYGILVSFASKKNTQGFYVDNGIIVVHPYGAIHIAQVLRNSILEAHSLKLDHKQLEERSQKLMDFIKSDDFKNSVDNTIYRTHELAKMLIDEFKEHKKMWEKRALHYNGIHINTHQIQISTKNILNGIPVNKSLILKEIPRLPSPNDI